MKTPRRPASHRPRHERPVREHAAVAHDVLHPKLLERAIENHVMLSWQLAHPNARHRYGPPQHIPHRSATAAQYPTAHRAWPRDAISMR